MKILQVSPYFHPYNGGQEVFVYNLSKNLIKAGHEVHVITSNYPSTSDSEIFDGINIKRYRCVSRPLRNPIAPQFLRLGKRLKDYDVIHMHNEHSFPSMVIANLKEINAKPLIITTHGQLKFGNYSKDFIEKIYNKTIGKRVFRKCDAIIALSESDKDYIASLGIDSEKIEIIPNAIDPLFLDYETMKACGEAYLLKKPQFRNKKIVLFVGPVIRRKGVEYLIRAIPYVLKSIASNEILFIITGSGDYINEAIVMAKKLNIEKFINFTGHLSIKDLKSIYAISTMFVLPSLSEGLPTSILEAMYFGLPVVSTDIPGIRDHFRKTAKLVQPKNEEALAKAIIELLSDQDLSAKMSREAKAQIINKYTWQIIAKKYLEEYERIIER